MKGWSKTTRIGVMMALDTVFLFIELGVGYYVSSLALIADAFHMVCAGTVSGIARSTLLKIIKITC